METTYRSVTIEVSFEGDGRVNRGKNGTAYSGGVTPPKLADKVAFFVHREQRDEDGLWNPVVGEGSFSGGLQINIWADSEGYREMGRYLLALAELDSSADQEFHEHHEPIQSADGRTRLHVICRKAPPIYWR